jgi:glycine cleavage system H protein
MSTYPDTLRYTKDHEWIRLEDDGKTATVGITAFAAGELGDIVYVTMPGVGEHYDAEQSFGSVEAVKTVSDLFMPLAGTIAEVNTDLDANPQHVNEDPYGQGWMVRVTLDDPAAVNDLMDADAYAAHAG